MTVERWQQVKDLLQKALELAPEERNAFLDQSCSSDHSLRREVENLLNSSKEVRSDFLRSSGASAVLRKGTKLGDYEVQALLGSGGMGEVFRARDERLGRDVAIKVLPQSLALDSERLRRFEQEAQAAAALNHPNILAVFQMGSYEGSPYLVSELLEGETLRECLKAGPVTVRKAVDYAIQIARGLAAAHDKGIVHRDLKPENLFVTRDGRVKILDFGLAKLVQAQQSDQATATLIDTQVGTVMGTAGYMAPEQVRGQAVDRRADIFAFGAILYEMLVGKRAFQGNTAADTMGAILKEDPPSLADFVTNLPPVLQRIIHRCLEKSPELRFQSASDLAFAMEAISGSAEGNAITAGRRSIPLWMLAGSAALLLITMIAVILWRKPSPEVGPSSPVRFAIGLAGEDTIGEHLGSSVALSPDGKQIAYVVNHGAERSIYVRSLDRLESVPVAGTEGGSGPFFSPDGDWIGFIADGKLKKVPVSGGRAAALCDVAVLTGASWGAGDTIVYTPNFNVGLFAISAGGGTPRRLTTPDATQGEFHFLPDFLPGGKEVIFTIWSGSASIDQSRLAVLSLDSGKWRVIMENGWSGRYAPGHLVFVRGTGLMTVPFDWKKFRTLGPAVSVADGVWRDLYGGSAHIAVSQSGSLAYIPASVAAAQRSLVWVSRSGERQLVSNVRNPYTAPRLSPDGRLLAMWMATEFVANVWIYDLARDTLSRLTFGADDHTAAWSPDGKMLAFESSRSGTHQLYIQPADGTGNPTQVTTGANEHYVCDWSPDGRYLAYVEWSLASGANLWTIEVGAQAHEQPRPLATTPFTEKQAAFSPDGRWIAFTSDESGQSEVYVQPFPGPGPKRQISSGGGQEPAWSHSGQELFYRTLGRMSTVAVRENDGELMAERPKPLFQGLFHYTPTFSRTYDVAPDGRFLMVAEPQPEHAPRQVNVVLNSVGASH